MDRRGFLSSLIAAGLAPALDPERLLWRPGAKLISIPKPTLVTTGWSTLPLFAKHWWRYWQPKGANLPPVMVELPDGSFEHRKALELPASFDLILQSWDMAFKDTKHSDYVVGGVMACSGGNRFLLHLVRDRMDFPATLLAVRQMCGLWPQVQLKLVEDKANGPALVQSLRKEIGGFVEVTPEGGKMSRAAAATPLLESGNWYLPHPRLAPWVDGFINECAAFPVGAHDDQVDMWSQGAKRLMLVQAKRPKPAMPQRSSSDRGWMV